MLALVLASLVKTRLTTVTYLRPQPEAYDLEAFNSGSELGFFVQLEIFLFGCYVVRAFSRACCFDLVFVHIWA